MEYKAFQHLKDIKNIKVGETKTFEFWRCPVCKKTFYGSDKFAHAKKEAEEVSKTLAMLGEIELEELSKQ